ncbi:MULTISPECIES: type II toxin-antitoxin system RelE/ParE family toxin [Methanocalculus]|uniref:type II toxin-antitoxin system RelE family toxin n=1 Tax=Methanocalculus TaxID=71151 RepID=UPI0020A03997|nr:MULTISPECIES: type II toxin-antitoxin system RelE/ParE family toxin [unclassified Methanocalculus]MCP1662111.1 mRNA interferase RelE/StbE [Methanocalculus sp. AMF5]
MEFSDPVVTYTIRYTPRADRDLEKLPKETARMVVRRISEIKNAPYLSIKKLKASNPQHPVYSLRIRRDIRALVSIHDDIVIIHVLEVESRKRSYRDF